MARLDRILRRLRPAFPELDRLRIPIAFDALPEDTLLRYDLEPGGNSILVNDCLRRAPVRALQGGIAHELAHLVRDCRIPRPARSRAYDRYDRSRPYRIRDERATDHLEIERGFGPHLLSFLRHARRLGYRFTPEHGLRYREIVQAHNRSGASHETSLPCRGVFRGPRARPGSAGV